LLTGDWETPVAFISEPSFHTRKSYRLLALPHQTAAFSVVIDEFETFSVALKERLVFAADCGKSMHQSSKVKSRAAAGSGSSDE
jgi:hypothetical protein